MSETFRVGDNVVFRTLNGELLTLWGMKAVEQSDLSWVVVDGTKYNAGTLQAKFDPLHHVTGFVPHVIAHPTENDVAAFESANAQESWAGVVSEFCNTVCEKLTPANLLIVEAALNGIHPQCQTCTFWRPPYDDFGPGNCHNQTVREMTRMGHETYPPPTPPEFGCNQWKAKQPPENGDDSDENG